MGKFKEKVEVNKSLSSLIKSRTGVDVYELGKSLIEMLKPENLEPSENIEGRIKSGKESIKKLLYMISNIDEDVEDTLKTKNYFQDCLNSLKDMEKNGTDIEELNRLSLMGKSFGDKKNMDVILDRISKKGEASLSDRERKDLDEWSSAV